MSEMLQGWLDRLGYSAEPAQLHLRTDDVPDTHPYALELRAMLSDDGAIGARAVFDVEGVPAVVFVSREDQPLSRDQLDTIRQRIWNQNLATVVIDVRGDTAVALPVRRLKNAQERLTLAEAAPDGPFSALEVASANLSERLPKWFELRARVDRKLLENLSAAVEILAEEGFKQRDDLDPEQRERLWRRLAELLMGQILFISYLEHRQIVGAHYRKRRGVTSLHELVTASDRDGIIKLIDCLRQDFNGDFLGDDRHDPWSELDSKGFLTLDSFLRRTNMRTGQGSFWNYDFSYIPVELLSGLYEELLSDEQQERDGAYYTPRHLAMLAVEQVLALSDNPLAERIFDGACGSGILLTTAFRRLLAHAEAISGRQLGFKERGELLQRQIFGADINEMACRVTAFSLYLSVLEGLDPADILTAQEREQVKLPSLKQTNLFYGATGDLFSPKHGFTGKRFTLILSNPPWTEPPGDVKTSADVWAESTDIPFVRRQIAGAFAMRALDFVEGGGKICLILPIGQFLGASSAVFVSEFLERVKPLRLINFGDLQQLLFPTAANTCHLFVGTARPAAESRDDGVERIRATRIPHGESFDYCVPKADLSLAFGRLTMQTADRHFLDTRSIAQDPQRLITYMWGDANDLSLWSRLSALGSFGDLWKGPQEFRQWVNRKGVHLEDKSRTPESADRLKNMKHVPIEALRTGAPVLHPDRLSAWPPSRTTVVGLNDSLMSVFDGPRVLFPDGFSRAELSIRAVFFDKPASFTHSVGVISGASVDAPLLRFATIYLRSSLARYFLMMRAWKMLAERNGVHLKDVETFPFFRPEMAPDPSKALVAMQAISDWLIALESVPELQQAARYEADQATLDEHVFNFFDLGATEKELVRETVDKLMPAIRPRGFKRMRELAQLRLAHGDLDAYARTLGRALTEWRERMGGQGQFEVGVMASEPSRAGPLGIVRVRYRPDVTDKPVLDRSQIDDALVLATVAQLREAGLTVIPSGDAMQLVPDTQIWNGGDLYLVRPLARRSWTVRHALRDAEQMVRTVQRVAADPSPSKRVPA
ncbi:MULTISPECIES: N-6 DNA methylase [Sphingomonadaceae]|uniref:HsdM family class I SAM-dependent methyltransferase n=1 Tax=Sphingomonadales TaxID=204457 RepID=UPI001815AB4B|nr:MULTISPECIES: N-6 DNA methylase [Sphingomonadaceae]MBA4762710.1 N-6 DNA methylase [Sphingomonas sp.]CAH0353847.1 hypothetical protein SPH9361_02702 [Sphingobium sp. CECT 9361]|tara:strand:+ start:969 stop:4127 length:3159 start_codon:yes stop_codon:yes gene_type:complete